MKKVLFLVGFVLMVLCLASCLNGSSGTESPQSIAPESLQKNVPQDYTDLGLPSGTVWKSLNEGYYTWFEAASRFGNRLPTIKQWKELKDKCKWSWTGNGYIVTGFNGNSIFLPAEGSSVIYNGRNLVSENGDVGYYWSSTVDHPGYARYFNFYSDFIGCALDYDQGAHFSVRLVLE